jgi:hypothetical protein
MTASGYRMSFHAIAFSISLEFKITQERHIGCGMIIIDFTAASKNIEDIAARGMGTHEIEFANQTLIL